MTMTMDQLIKQQHRNRKQAKREAGKNQNDMERKPTYEDLGGTEKSRVMDDFARNQVKDRKQANFERRHMDQFPDRKKAIFPDREKATNEMDDGFREASRKRMNHYEATERFRRANFEKKDPEKEKEPAEKPKSELQKELDAVREQFKELYGFYPGEAHDDDDQDADQDPDQEQPKKITMDDLFRKDFQQRKSISGVKA